jgi:hypothetical protein
MLVDLESLFSHPASLLFPPEALPALLPPPHLLLKSSTSLLVSTTASMLLHVYPLNVHTSNIVYLASIPIMYIKEG